MSKDDKKDSNSCCGGHQTNEKKETESTQCPDMDKSADSKPSLNRTQSGLTQELGKPLVDSSDSLSKQQADVESSYMQIKKAKRFAMSGISSAFGDLLGSTTERAKQIEEESRAKLAETLDDKKCQSTTDSDKKKDE